MNKPRAILLAILLLAVTTSAAADSIPSGFRAPVQWHIGAEISPAWVPSTSRFLEGVNPRHLHINQSISGAVRADFSFSPTSRQGMLYKGLYQGIGIGINSFYSSSLLGTPVSAYVYQGAPIVRFGQRLWLGYEWQFGAAFGWKHFNAQTTENNAVVSTAVTAHIGLRLKLHYRLSDRWRMSLGVGACHYSNGNTSWPNSGVNSIGATVGMTYLLNPADESTAATDAAIEAEADRHDWYYDITVFGSWRKRVVNVGEPPTPDLCPGRFGVLGLQFAPLYRLNRYVAVGPAVDMQWDESAGLAPYWISGTAGSMIKFIRPPFGKQINVGLSAHAELTMPIFSVNAGVGYDLVCPRGDRRFYQSLTLKTFITRHLYLNTGYRIGGFKDPQNLMLGLGVRL